jgi:hypothetical protein
MTTRFPNGITNQPNGNMALAQFLDPAKFHVWFSDFDNYTAADWTASIGTTSSTHAAITGDGGLAAFSIAVAKDDELVSVQWDGNSGAVVQESFLFDATKEMYWKARLKVNDAVESDFRVGLMITDTSPLTTTDQMLFSKDDGSAVVSFVTTKDSTSSTQALGTLVSDTYATLGVTFMPGKGFMCFFNEAYVGVIDATTNAPNDEDLAITIAVQSGAAAITTLTMDYLLVAKQR